MENENLTKSSEKKHNGIISFWKFAFAMMIVLFHATEGFAKVARKGFFHFGYIGVEFFFLVSGFLLGKAALSSKENDSNNNLGKDTFNFILKKIKSFFPYILFAGITGLIIQNVFNEKMTIYDNITSIWNLLLLRANGMRCHAVIGQVWYISAMLISMIFLYPLIKKYKKNFVYIIAPLITILGFGYLSHKFGNLRGPDKWLGFCTKGLFRCFVELSLGVILYAICEKIKKIDFTKFGKFLITAIEILGFVSIFVIAQFVKKNYYDFIEVLILSISITLAFSQKTLDYKILTNKFSFWLEKLSLPLYLMNVPVREYILGSSHFVGKSYSYKTFVFLIITFILTLICTYVIDFLKSKNFYLDKIKRLIVK